MLVAGSCGSSQPGGPPPGDVVVGSDGNPFQLLDLSSGGDGGPADGGGPGNDGSPGGNDAGGPLPTCGAATQGFIYLLSEQEELIRFDPMALTFTVIGQLDCPVSSFNPNDPLGAPPTPFSMAVSRGAVAYVEYNDGTLWQVDTMNAHCTATAFQPLNNETFGMGFSSDAQGSAAETLYISVASADGLCSDSRLGKILLPSFGTRNVGSYDQVSTCAELTGTGDARLFGAFEGNPFIIAEIDKTNGHIKSMMPTSVQVNGAMYNFAFATYGGTFWLFVGPGTSTDVYQVDMASGMATKKTSTDKIIVGAGVSTCAPYRPQG
jgi:hypothetical protein